MSVHSKGIIFALVSAVLWGSSGVLAEYIIIETQVEAEWLVASRMVLSGFLLLVYQALRGQPIFALFRNKHDLLLLLIFAIFGMLLDIYCYFLCIQASNAATATALLFLGPAFVLIITSLRLRQLPRRVEMVGLLLALAGVFLIATKADLGNLAITPLALLTGLLSAVGLAIYALFSVPLLRRCHAGTLIGWGNLLGGLAISPIAQPWHIGGEWSIAPLLALAALIIVCTMITFSLNAAAIGLIGAPLTSMLTSVEPMCTAIIAAVTLKTPLLFADYLGILLITVMVALLAAPKRQVISNSE